MCVYYVMQCNATQCNVMISNVMLHTAIYCNNLMQCNGMQWNAMQLHCMYVYCNVCVCVYIYIYGHPPPQNPPKHQFHDVWQWLNPMCLCLLNTYLTSLVFSSTYLVHLVSVQLICFIWSSSNRQIYLTFGIQTYLLHLVSVQLICFIWSSSNRQIPFQWHKLIYFISYPLKWITSNGTNWSDLFA